MDQDEKISRKHLPSPFVPIMNMKQGSSINDQEDQWRECVDASNRHFSAFVDRSAAPARVQRRQEEHLPPYHI